MTKRPNIILISADSLRADHLGCYGFPLDTSPNLDRIASEGVLCERMFCPVIPTQPSHTTLFTGQHPLTHGVVAHGGKARLARSQPFLPEILLSEGYTTCAVDTLFRERQWFARGYEYIIDPTVHHVFYASVMQEELTSRLLNWIQTVPTGPFFSFIHYWDVHYPYTPPERLRNKFYAGGKPIDPENRALDEWWTHPIGAMARDTWLRTPQGVITDPNYVTNLYDAEIRYLDEGIAAIKDTLDRIGALEDTIILLLADHGESMTEHRIFYDHYGLYDCVTRVPFILHWPNGNLKTGLRLEPMRQLSDVAPTLLEACDVVVPPEMDGESFLAQLRGEEPQAGYDRVISCESTWQAKYSVRTDTHKFILARQADLLGNPMRELYDLKTDPLELNNIAEQEPKLAAIFEAGLEEWIAQKLAANGKTEDPVTKEGASMIATWSAHKA